MKNTNKKVSIIIPTYKREIKFLSRAINSVKDQTYQHIEIVVIDDNPPQSKYRKKTMKYMEKHKNDPNIVYIVNPKNLGGSLARNVGIKAATGSYITFLDDDDKYLPNKIKKQIEFMQEHDFDMSFTDLKIANEKDITVDFREHSNLKKFDEKDFLKYHIMHHLTGTPTFMYKTEKLRFIKGFEEAIMGQEFFLMVKTIENDLNIGYLPECDVVAYRHSESGISKGSNKILGEKILYNFKKKYFYLFTIRERMFIRFRHYAVLAIVYSRNNSFINSFFYSIIAVISSPIDFIQESFSYTKKILINNKESS